MKTLIILATMVFSLVQASLSVALPQPGKPAPGFSLLDSNGKKRALSDFQGKTVVLEWNNPFCPFVRAHYDSGTMQALQKEATKDGVVWLLIGSNNPKRMDNFGGKHANKFLKERKSPATAYLLDPKGTVGRLYEAKTALNMVVINPQGELVYQGAIDDKPTTDPTVPPTSKSYVRTALADIKAGRTVETPITRSYGCAIDYAPLS